jgi:hypothetical protein
LCLLYEKDIYNSQHGGKTINVMTDTTSSSPLMVNHSAVGHYKRLTYVTVRQENTTLDRARRKSELTHHILELGPIENMPPHAKHQKVRKNVSSLPNFSSYSFTILFFFFCTIRFTIFYFFFAFTISLIWFGGQFWHQVVSALSRSQLRRIEPWSSRPSSISITTKLTNDWLSASPF